MKKLLQPSRIIISPVLFLFLIITFFAIQAQIPDRVFNDKDPLIEQPTRESYSHFYPPSMRSPDVITVDDYDNFDVGTDTGKIMLQQIPIIHSGCFSGLTPPVHLRMHGARPMED
jgi:hypothetical protein